MQTLDLSTNFGSNSAPRFAVVSNDLRLLVDICCGHFVCSLWSKGMTPFVVIVLDVVD